MFDIKKVVPIGTELISKIPMGRKAIPQKPSFSQVYTEVIGAKIPQEESEYSETKETQQDTQAKGTACLPCTANHLHACVGVLNEAVRFAQKDGINDEVIKRINICMGELVAGERIDLSPEAIADLPLEQKEIAKYARVQIREIRHSLENLSNADQLEAIAAQTAKLQNNVARKWFISKLSPEQREKVKKKAQELLNKEMGEGQSGE